MKPARPTSVYRHRLPAPRATLWGPLLLACLLSLPVLIVTVLATVF